MSDFSSSSASGSSSSDDDEDNVGDTSGSDDSSSDDSDGKMDEDSKQDLQQSWMLPKRSITEKNIEEGNANSQNTSNDISKNATNTSGSEDLSVDDNKSSSNSESEGESKGGFPRKHIKEDLRTLWESNPQIYGVRRSSRARKEPQRLTVLQESDDSDGNRKRKKENKKGMKHGASDYTATLTESESEESTSGFDSPPAHHRRNKSKNGQSGRQKSSNRPSRLSQMRAKLEGRKKGNSKRNKGRRQCDMSEESTSDDEERPQRSSTRIQKAKISYKEESQDETDSDDVVEVVEKEDEYLNSECIERIIDCRVGKPSATGGPTTSYATEADGDPNAGFNPENGDGEQQYLIKWKGWSHLHNTWESEKSLQDQKVRGFKKFENFIKKKEELDAWLRVASPEDAEYFLCQQELGRDLSTTYQQVERVIAKSRVKNRFGFWDYQIKWKGLPYGECTWEDGELIGRSFQDKIDKFEVRQDNVNVPRRDAKKRSHVKFIPMKQTPHWLEDLDNLQLRDYQMDGVNWLAHSWCRNNSVILADEMGLGKTIQSITFFSYLYHIYDVYGPFLIIVPLSTIAAWQKEFQLWASFMNIIVFVGDAISRNTIRDVEWVFPNKKLKFNVVLTTYEILLKEKVFLGSHTWAVIAVDEAHRLKNEDSLLYRSLIEFKSHHRLLITGTPLQNSLKELWSLLHFIMPEKFDSWTDFEDRHSNERETGYTSLHGILQPFLLRRVKKDVEKSLPAKVERILRVEMSSIQKQYYRWILTKNYRELMKGAKARVASFCNIVMELKKCCNHAFLTKSVEKEPANNEEKLQSLIKSSGKMILLDKLLTRLREDGHRVLIFSQMVRMLDLLQEYLILNRLTFQRLDGSIKGEVRRQALEHFNAPGSEDFCFLLSTRAGGLGINLASADTVIIFDSDWNPQNDLQAQARAHRIGQKNQVNIYRLVCVGSVEEDIIERAKRKMVLDHLVIQRMDTSGKTVLSKNNAPSASTGNPFNKDELSAILKFGAEDIFKEVEGEEKEPECDIDEILRRAETTEEQTESGAGDELLSAFKFATFTIDEDEDATPTSTVRNEDEDSRDGLKEWDDIIPESDRKIIEEEERRKQEAELYLPPRARKSLRIHNGGSDSDAGSEDSDDDASDDDDAEENNDASSKKKGRTRRQKDEFSGFTSTEVRKFVKSFRKFGDPLDRLDSIARDAELTVQSEADLKRLGVQLDNQLRDLLQAYNKSLLQNLEVDQPTQQNSKRGPSFRIGGASVSVKTTMACIEELQPLVEVMSKVAEERKNFRLTIPVKPIRGWDCEWTSEDDSNLLIGIYEYGMGSWEQIQSDTSLQLSRKILRPNNEKPQAKQLQSRVEYLMKLLRKTKELGRAPTGITSVSNSALSAAASRVARKVRQGKKADVNSKNDDMASSKKRSRKIKSKARVEINDDSDAEPGSLSTPMVNTTTSATKKDSSSRKMQKKPKSNAKNSDNTKENHSNQNTVNNKNSTETKNRKIKRKHKTKENEKLKEEIGNTHSNDKKKSEKHKTERKASDGPVHITAAADPVPIAEDEFSGELDLDTFKDCKERMRPVKKALKLLDKRPSGTNNDEKAQAEHMKNCILKIGDRVLECLKECHGDLVAIKTWRRNLWIFVSKFTEFNAQRLHKVYKRASRKREQERDKNKVKHSHLGSGDHSTHRNTSDSKFEKNSNSSPRKNVAGKKRNHSPNKNRGGAGDGPTTAPKRSFNTSESRHRERVPPHPANRKGENFHERPDDRVGRESPGGHSRYHGQGHPRNLSRDDRRFGDEDFRFSHSSDSRRPDRSWPGEVYRYHREEEFRRQGYEHRSMYEQQPRVPRDDRAYHRSSYGERVWPDSRHGEWDDRYYPNSDRVGSPYRHHPKRSRSPPHQSRQYYNVGRAPGPSRHSPGHVQDAISPNKQTDSTNDVT
ncbi:chromodomain-helicase-DNA-binding protein 1-like isoform X2 [Styela clava]